MSARRAELTRIAARLFAERGYQGTSLADLADALGVQKPSLYHHIDAKEDLLWEVAWEGAEAFRAALDGVPADLPATERIRLALRGHLAVVADQLDVATVFVREWRYLEGERRERFVAERRRYEERVRDLFRDGVERSELRTDLDVSTAALLFLSAANWAYTWLRPGSSTDDLVRHILFAQAMLPAYADLFRGLDDGELEALADSFRLARRERLCALVASYAGEPAASR